VSKPMRTRRLFSSFAGSVVVAVLMGCNAIVGTEEIDYEDTFDPTDDEPDDRDQGKPDTGPDRPDADADADADAYRDADAHFIEDGPIREGGFHDALWD